MDFTGKQKIKATREQLSEMLELLDHPVNIYLSDRTLARLIRMLEENPQVVLDFLRQGTRKED